MKDLYHATRAILYPGAASYRTGRAPFQIEGFPLLASMALARFERLNRGHQHLLNDPLMAFDNQTASIAAQLRRYRRQETLGQSTAGLVRALAFDAKAEHPKLSFLMQAQDQTGWIECWTIHQLPWLDSYGQELLESLGFSGEVRLRMLASREAPKENPHVRYARLNINVRGRVYNLARRLEIGEHSLTSLASARALVTQARHQLALVIHEFASHPDAQPYRKVVVS